MDLTTLAMVRKFMNEKPAGNATPQPTGTIEITENGTGIDVAQYAFADINVNGGNNNLNFGELITPVLGIMNSVPVVNDELTEDFGIFPIKSIGINAETTIMSFQGYIQSDFLNIAPGCYVKSAPSNVTSVNVYVCVFGRNTVNDTPFFSSVTAWDGQVDLIECEENNYHQIGFILPELIFNSPQTSLSSTILVFAVDDFAMPDGDNANPK